MKTNLAMAALVTLAISACSTTPGVTTEGTPGTSGQNPATVETSPMRPSEVKSAELAAQLDEMQNQSIYFDFGDTVIKPEYNGLLQQQAEIIKAHANAVVTLQGNADERGSSEYNLALGDRRAISVRKALELIGVADSQIKTVSLGEEHPRRTCHEEQCWKENRRVDFIGKIVQ